jgi:RimJ/RimL family protein N-acetyltransferase
MSSTCPVCLATSPRSTGYALGRGLGTEATALVLRHAFTALRLHRVELSVYAFNPRAKRAYEKAGFRTEGVLRDALRLEDGQRVDAVVMAALAPQWLAGDHPRA